MKNPRQRGAGCRWNCCSFLTTSSSRRAEVVEPADTDPITLSILYNLLILKLLPLASKLKSTTLLTSTMDNR